MPAPSAPPSLSVSGWSVRPSAVSCRVALFVDIDGRAHERPTDRPRPRSDADEEDRGVAPLILELPICLGPTENNNWNYCEGVLVCW